MQLAELVVPASHDQTMNSNWKVTMMKAHRYTSTLTSLYTISIYTADWKAQ